jgi:hypothetical protein
MSRGSAPVAQLDRVPDFGSGCCRFESCRVRSSVIVTSVLAFGPDTVYNAGGY